MFFYDGMHFKEVRGNLADDLQLFIWLASRGIYFVVLFLDSYFGRGSLSLRTFKLGGNLIVRINSSSYSSYKPPFKSSILG